MSSDSEYKNRTKVEMNKIVSFGNDQIQNQALLAGELLKAMDITACLSAERHARLPCVTLMMDDLKVSAYLEKLGQVLNVQAELTRAFGSSMEVVVKAALEDLGTGDKTNICNAYFTFVAIAKTGKAKLSHIDPVTIEERLEYALAVERRKIRFKAAAKEKLAIPAKISPGSSTCSDESTLVPTNTTSEGIPMSCTSTESIELVLPSHANHHQTTFGGQIMAWLVSTCTIAASKCCHSSPSIEAVNNIHFLERSTVGDRLIFKAMVNKTFDDDNSMEVGCRVEASDIGGNIRHINSAYLTFVDYDENKKRKSLPRLLPATKEQFERQKSAVDRRQAQEEKNAILQSIGPALSVPWSKDNSNILAYHNVSAFKKLCHLENWAQVSQDKNTESILSKCTLDQFQCVKVESVVKKSAKELFTILNTTPRCSWDPVVAQAKVLNEIDEDDKIVHYVMATSENATEKPGDLLLLQSSRTPSDKQDNYLIAFRSITLKPFPSAEDYTRKENLSSGFLIEECEQNPGVSKLIYINQITHQLNPYLFSDLSGETKVYAKRINKLQAFLLHAVV